MPRLRAITPQKKAYNVLSQQASRFFVDGMNDFTEIVRDDFLVTVKSWKGKPSFERTVKSGNKSVEGKVATDNDIYRFVSGGTRVRYATMSSDWQSKSRPGSMQSGPGRGRVLFISKKYPRPGIEAREFDKQIKERREKLFFQMMSDRLVGFAKLL